MGKSSSKAKKTHSKPKHKVYDLEEDEETDAESDSTLSSLEQGFGDMLAKVVRHHRSRPRANRAKHKSKAKMVRTTSTSAVGKELGWLNDETWLLLGSGIATAAIICRMEGICIRPRRVICVEISDKARRAAVHANPRTETFPGLEHVFHSVEDITEEWIYHEGPNISVVVISMPCSDFTALTLAEPRDDRDRRLQMMGMARPGLRGSKGKLNLLAVDIADQIELRNPELIVLLETVKFKDLKADHDTMTSRMRGEPVYIDSADYSYTKRLRAWYLRAKDHSVFPQDLIGPRSPLDPDQCMDPGRTLVRKPKSGSVGTINASWRGGNKPVAYTNFPVLVQDEAEDELQHLRPHEAEKLHAAWAPT